MGVGGNGNVESHSRTSLVTTCHDEIAKCTCVTLGGKMARLGTPYRGALRVRNACQCEVCLMLSQSPLQHYSLRATQEYVC